MNSKINTLLNNYENVLKEPWNAKLSGHEKVWFLVYDPSEQRKISLYIGDFERITRKNNKKWVKIDLLPCFPKWMSQHEYREAYFNEPDAIQDQLETDFKEYVVKYISTIFKEISDIQNTVVAFTNIGAIFGFLKLSDIMEQIYHLNKGRILIFFPGEYQNNHFRLLDARDGWSYLARPITA